MRITISATDPFLSELARRRFAFALGRFQAHVRSVTVRVRDVNGPRGGVDQRCRVTVRLAWPAPPLVLEDIDAQAAVAISLIAERTARTVARAVDASTGRRTLARREARR